MSLAKYLLIPQLVLYGLRAPRDQAQAWERYWSGVHRTGPDGEVFWDGANQAELAAVLTRLTAHADPGLPLVDLGCGHGRQARALAALSPRVLGLDRSASAIERARAETADEFASRPSPGTVPEFRVADAAEPGLGERLHEELGDANVHIRGMLHVVPAQQQPDVVRNLAAILGRGGVAYVSETDVSGDPLETLRAQGMTLTSIPDPLRRLVAAGVRPPRHFGHDQVAEYFPSERWQVLDQGPVMMYGVPLQPGAPMNEIPGYFAMLRAAAGQG